MDGNTVELIVCGVYQTGLDMLDRGLAFSPQNEWMGKDLDWSAAIFLKPGVDVGPVMAIYRTRFQEPNRFETWERQMPDLRQLIDLEAISMAIVMVLVFAVVAIGIACSFVIFIIRNLREYGVLKAMGVSTAEMSLLIVAKVVLMNAVACCAGLVIGALAVGIAVRLGGIDIGAFTSHNRYFAVSGVIVPRLTAFSLWAPPAVSLGFSLLASVWPAVLVRRKKAADILRAI
jgi:ABC-type lipoprotein release transport system permease subunit